MYPSGKTRGPITDLTGAWSKAQIPFGRSPWPLINPHQGGWPSLRAGGLLGRPPSPPFPGDRDLGVPSQVFAAGHLPNCEFAQRTGNPALPESWFYTRLDGRITGSFKNPPAWTTPTADTVRAEGGHGNQSLDSFQVIPTRSPV